jgi:hypothetical protein
LIDDGLWSSLSNHEHEGGNSHMPVLDRYQRMLPVYRAVVADRKANGGRGVFDAHRFEVNDLQKVLAATRRPGARSSTPKSGITDTEVTHEH